MRTTRALGRAFPRGPSSRAWKNAGVGSSSLSRERGCSFRCTTVCACKASAAFFRLTLSRSSQSPLVNTRTSANRMDASMSGRGRLEARRLLRTGKRAREVSASTSVNAFELRRISSDALGRVTDVASNQLIVDTSASEYRSESDFPAC